VGDLVGAAATLFAAFMAMVVTLWAIKAAFDQIRAGDRAAIVLSPPPREIEMLASAEYLIARPVGATTATLRLTNSGPGAAQELIVEGQLLVDRALERLVDAARLCFLGMCGGSALGYVGAPVGLALGHIRNGRLSSDHKTYEFASTFAVHFDAVPADKMIEIEIPVAVMRALTFYQTVAEQHGARLWAPLRVSVRYRTRMGFEHEHVAIYGLAGRAPRLEGDTLVYTFRLYRSRDRDVSRSLRRRNFTLAERRRYARYLGRVQRVLDKYHGEAPHPVGKVRTSRKRRG
jgi:hypothetical protein